MTERSMEADDAGLNSGQQAPVAAPAKKKAGWSWTYTILWMLGMMLLVNVVMAAIAYLMHRYGYF